MVGTAHPTRNMIAKSPTSLPDFVEDLLREQQDLSAVEQFARDHVAGNTPTAEKRYRALLPATAPQPGQQYGFEVDLDCCSGCKACVTACHAMNGLDETETWREVGLLVGGSRSLPVLQHVTTACHHCVEPGCMSACPTLAYEKDPLTGIVKHLDDQCFGCQYCVLACPYEVPKYHASKGIVRKCDMCSSRLKAGEAPACVQACPHEAIRIALVTFEDVQATAATTALLPTAPASRFTLPTTRYLTARAVLSEVRSGDEDAIHPEHNHVPLMLGLVFSQIAVGLILAAVITTTTQRLGLLLAGSTIGFVASLAATAHLGRPWLAYRAVLGWRTSWLSREIMALGAFQAGTTLSLMFPASTMIVGLTGLLGLLGVFSSVMIYAVTPRTFWAFPFTAMKFLGTTVLVATLASGLVGDGGSLMLMAASVVGLGKLIAESRQCHCPGDDRWAERSARLLHGPLKDAWLLRCGLMLMFGVVGPLVMVSVPDATTSLGVILGLGSLCAELVERSLFFRAAAAPRMPGGMAS